LAKLEAKQCQVDESILLDRNGFVAECTGQNIFIIKNGKIKTPMPYLILEGFTRDTVIQFIKNNKMNFEECLITRDQLYLADEIFIVGTANEILPVVEVDGRTIGCGRPGSMTLEIQGFYDLVVRGEVGDFSDYLDWV
jgi:branched-chain amino acid aminotransferase